LSASYVYLRRIIVRSIVAKFALLAAVIEPGSYRPIWIGTCSQARDRDSGEEIVHLKAASPATELPNYCPAVSCRSYADAVLVMHITPNSIIIQKRIFPRTLQKSWKKLDISPMKEKNPQGKPKSWKILDKVG